MYAASEGQIETILVLIRLGADIEATDESDQTAESHAIRHGHDEVAQCIREQINGQISV